MDTTPLLFVSHSHEDDTFCQRLIADLRANLGDEAVWYDVSGGLHGGDDWWNRIIAEITERPYFLVVLSPNASASKWVPQEMAIAFRQHVELGKRLLPVRLAESPRREDWRGIQEFDFTQTNDPAHYAAALAEVLRLIDPKLTVPIISASPASPMPAAPERPLSPTERLAKETHTAYAHEHWSDVLDKTEILVERGAMTPALWRERASAAFALGNNNSGLAVVKQALQAGVDDADTLLLYTRLTTRVGDDKQTVEILTRAYALASLGDTTTRLAILDELTAVLNRLGLGEQGRWDEFARRVSDARRMAPDDPRWALREVEALLHAQRYDEAVAAVRALPAMPAGMDAAQLLPAWHSAVSSATMGRWDGKNWQTYRALLNAAKSAGIDPTAIARWQFEFPHFVPVVTISGQSGPLGRPIWSPNGALLAAEGAGGVRVWDTASGRLLGTIAVSRLPYGDASGIVWSPDSTRLAVGGGGAGRIFDAASGRLLVTLGSQALTGIRRILAGANSTSNYIRTLIILAWSPNRLWLATASDAGIQVWDAASGSLLASLTGNSYYPFQINVAWSPDGSLLATTVMSNAPVSIWNVANGRLLATLSDGRWPVAWSPDSKRLATASTNGAQIWDAPSWRPLITLADHLKEVNVLAWAPDGARLVISGEGQHGGIDKAEIWEVASGLHVAIPSANTGHISEIQWSADGRRLVGIMFWPTIWDAASGQVNRGVAGNFLDQPSTELRVIWSPDGTRIASAGKDGTVLIWGEE